MHLAASYLTPARRRTHGPLAVSLVGCGDIAEKAAEDAFKDEGIDADIDGSDISIEGTDFNITTGKLPRDFPVDEVPVVDGKILQGAYTKNSQTRDTTIELGPAGGDKHAAYDAAEEKLRRRTPRAHRQRHRDQLDLRDRQLHRPPLRHRLQQDHRQLPSGPEVGDEPTFWLMHPPSIGRSVDAVFRFGAAQHWWGQLSGPGLVGGSWHRRVAASDRMHQ
jgi:hypothetical protein